jgi:hypothetical protein
MALRRRIGRDVSEALDFLDKVTRRPHGGDHSSGDFRLDNKRLILILRDRSMLAIALVVAATYTGIGMVVPVRVLYAQAHGASLTIIGAIASAFLLANFLCQYPMGWLADRWGRMPVMLAGPDGGIGALPHA